MNTKYTGLHTVKAGIFAGLCLQCGIFTTLKFNDRVRFFRLLRVQNLTFPTRKTIQPLNFSLQIHEKHTIPTQKTITAPPRVQSTLRKTP